MEEWEMAVSGGPMGWVRAFACASTMWRVRMKCIYDRARDLGTLGAYQTVPAGCGRPSRAGGRVHMCHYGRLLLVVVTRWACCIRSSSTRSRGTLVGCQPRTGRRRPGGFISTLGSCCCCP
eukprot:scaffold64990_cov50-Attheya_sp.AAC.1